MVYFVHYYTKDFAESSRLIIGVVAGSVPYLVRLWECNIKNDLDIFRNFTQNFFH